MFKYNVGSEKKPRILTVLDIGSSKIACFIAKITPNNNALLSRANKIEILGHGVCLSIGVKGGIISDMNEAVRAIKHVVAEAEKAAKIEVKSILVAINSAHIKSTTMSQSINVAGQTVDRPSLEKLKKKIPHNPKEAILHCLPIAYYLDESLAIENPLDMVGASLSGKYQILSIDSAVLQNLELCLQKCYLEVEAVVAAPFASSLAVLLEQEMAMGSICIDIGASTTNCAVFVKDRLIYATSVPCGSNHISLDVEKGLGVSLAEAEQLKCVKGFLDARVKKRGLTSIITARAEEILQLIYSKLKKVDKNFVQGKTIVLTGGGSYLGGYTELAESIFKTKVRLGRPLGYANIQALPNSAAYATALGLLVYPEYLQKNNAGTESETTKYFSFRNPFLTLGKKLIKSCIDF